MQSKSPISFSIEPGDAGKRLDKILPAKFPDHSRAYYQKLIETQAVTVNGNPVRASFQVKPDDEIVIQLIPESQPEILAEDIPLDVVYEDDHIIVVNKPAGLVVHPGAGVPDGTLVNALLHHCDHLASTGGPLRPGIVHRLDKNTSGLLVAAKTDMAYLKLSKQFADKTAYRIYLALVWGIPDESEGQIETLVNRSKRDRKLFTVAESGKTAITHFSVIRNYGFLSLLELQLKTGRTHQIRIHANYIHHPIFGDPEYHGRSKQISGIQNSDYRILAKRLLGQMPYQALHAHKLGLIHPESGKECLFSAAPPDNFQLIIDELEASLQP